ncbi:hypothetical protein A6A08_21115 [Nocardiopsis sp. TSRI0078]|nr:hypothetical protein A6A08_21110 [Nocardiopsis sp. TSRI0078]OKI21298.1 hypothetical protein A6A08_21115 [Nocardiopsis sp. TSRI0078]
MFGFDVDVSLGGDSVVASRGAVVLLLGVDFGGQIQELLGEVVAFGVVEFFEAVFELGLPGGSDFLLVGG